MAALLALGGCVDASRPARRAVAVVVVRERALEAAPVASPERGVTHHVLDAQRQERRGDVVVAADDVPPAPITAYARGARGWVFVAGADVYGSATFTGRLRLLRSFRCEASSAASAELRDHPVTLSRSHGRVAVRTAAFGVFASDGATLAPLGLPGAVDLAWRDASRGVAIVAHETLWLTSDGGESWREVDTRGAMPVMVEGHADGLIVATEHGVWRVDEARRTLVEGIAPEPRCAYVNATPQFDRRFDLAPTGSADTCANERPLRHAAWGPPRFDVALQGLRYHRPRDPDVDGVWTLTGARSVPFGAGQARTYLDFDAVPVVAQAPGAIEPRGYVGPIRWRGGDAAGPFEGSALVRQPPEVPWDSTWRLVAATRRGVFVLLDAMAPGHRYAGVLGGEEQASPTLFHLSAAGMRRMSGTRHPLFSVVSATPTDDGGLVLIRHDQVRLPQSCETLDERSHTRTVSYAVWVDAEGGERGERAVVDVPTVREAVGVGQRGGRWGMVVAVEGELTWLPFGGGREAFGAWGLGETPRVCGAAPSEVTRLHLAWSEHDASASVFLGPRAVSEEEPAARVRQVVLERDAEGVCVRRVTGVHSGVALEVSRGDFRPTHGVLSLDAVDGGLSGVWDDGRNIGPLRATLTRPPE